MEMSEIRSYASIKQSPNKNSRLQAGIAFGDNVAIIWSIWSTQTMTGDIQVLKMKVRRNSVILLCTFHHFLSHSLLCFPADNVCLTANLKLQTELWKPTGMALWLWRKLDRETATTKNACHQVVKHIFLTRNHLDLVLVARGRSPERHPPSNLVTF